MQRQVDEYENEIRALKDFKSPGKGSRNRTPRRAITSVADISSPYGRSGTEETQTNTGALEATIFRPALQRALKDASKWKAASMASVLDDLPPLPSPARFSGGTKDAAEKLMELTSALADFRLEKASFSLVDLTRKDKSARAQLRESNLKKAMAYERLQSVVQLCQQ